MPRKPTKKAASATPALDSARKRLKRAKADKAALETGDPAEAAGEALTPQEWAALQIASKQASKHVAGVAVATGQPVDFSVRIAGAISKSAGVTCQVTKTPKLEDVVAMILFAVGTKEQVKLCGRVIELYKKRASVVLSGETAAMAENLLGKISYQAPQQQKGALTGSLAVSKVPSG